MALPKQCPLQQGDPVGDYEIDELLLRREYKRTVYRCHSRLTGEKVVIKHNDRSSDLERHRIISGYTILEKIEHPGVVKAVEKFTIKEGVIAAVYQYVEGKTLAQYLDEQRPVPEEVIKQYLRKASGILFDLERQHNLNITLYDAQTRNIIIRDDDTLCLIDFDEAELRLGKVGRFSHYFKRYLKQGAYSKLIKLPFSMLTGELDRFEYARLSWKFARMVLYGLPDGDKRRKDFANDAKKRFRWIIGQARVQGGYSEEFLQMLEGILITETSSFEEWREFLVG